MDRLNKIRTRSDIETVWYWTNIYMVRAVFGDPHTSGGFGLCDAEDCFHTACFVEDLGESLWFCCAEHRWGSPIPGFQIVQTG